MKEKTLYRIMLPDSEYYIKQYNGRMEKLVHHVRAYSSQQALSTILAPRRLSFLYEDLLIRMMDDHDELITCEEVTGRQEAEQPARRGLDLIQTDHWKSPEPQTDMFPGYGSPPTYRKKGQKATR